MNHRRLALGACALAGALLALTQTRAQQHPMTFFVTSTGVPGGANFGGIAGADRHCQELAAAVGAGNHTWHAYLSEQERPGHPAINARDRIGSGPWYNARGDLVAKDVADLHAKEHLTGLTLTEQGVPVPSEGTPAHPDDKTWAYMAVHPESIRHEILTGSNREGRAYADGRDHTCNNWTSEEDGNSPNRARFNTGPGAQIGKSDETGPWNDQGISGGCSHVAMARSHGAGLNYCFAVE